jgi:hypothetical protein
MFYGLTAGTGNDGPTDYPAPIAVGASVPFPRDGPALGITRLNASSFNLPNIGTYEISFYLYVNEPGQLQLLLNGTALPETTSSNALGSVSISGTFFITTNTINSVIAIISTLGSPSAFTIIPPSSGPANAQRITIKQIN